MVSYIKSFLKKYPHTYTLLIGAVLLLWFRLLERYIQSPENIMHTFLDDYIPFSKIFVIPYLFWFVYIGAAMVYFFFKSKTDFLRLSAFLYTGMSICYIIYMIYPSGQELRPVVEGNDILARIVRFVYATDTPVNCFPSIHVIDAIAVNCAVWNSEGLRNRHMMKISSIIAMVLICISTVTLKQHSILDVFAGIGVSLVLYVGIYKIKWHSAAREQQRESV